MTASPSDTRDAIVTLLWKEPVGLTSVQISDRLGGCVSDQLRYMWRKGRLGRVEVRYGVYRYSLQTSLPVWKRCKGFMIRVA